VKNLRLVCAALAFVVAGAWAANSHACDKHKTQATTASAAKSAKTVNATTAGTGDACGAKSTNAATFTTASATGAAAGDACCASKGATAAKSSKSAKPTSVNAVAAGAGAGCGSHDAGSVSAMAAGAGGSCSSHGAKGATAKNAHDCDACDDLAMCGPDGLLNEGASIQTVALKNGVMFVYTAANAGQVSAIQSAMHRRGERLSKLVAAGDKASLCSGCKDFRGAMASGKLQREVVNIEGGTLVLMTSSDPAMVKKIRTMADASKTAAQVKS
jgi:hypothetical protein